MTTVTNNKTTDEYIGQNAQDVLKNWSIDPESGLDNSQAKARFEHFGPNEIEAKEESLWHRIFRRFWGPIPWMIEIAAVLSAMVQKWEDFIIITIMLLVNALLDFFQEHRALNALKALKQQMVLEVRVLREGHFITIPARELVPGDIIRLRIGDIIPADIQLLDGDYLSIDESALTGESLPVTKSQDDVAYANTIIKQGEMRALVVNTGLHTRFSSVVGLVAKASLEERSHFQKMVIQIGNFLIIITIILVALIMVVGLFRHEDFMELARFAMVLTVAAIPVALPAVLSVTMAVGAVNLAKKRAIVSRLTAIEELAGVDIFCSDKTGTLTKNEMQVAKPITLDGHTEEELFLYAILASRKENNDPIEVPLFHYLEQKFPNCHWQQWEQTSFTPFDPTSKRTSATVTKDNEKLTVFKGAAQVLLAMTELTDNETTAINNSIDLLASKGYRTLAVAIQYEGESLELIGLIPLIDPPREDSLQVIKDMKSYGVEVKMITGDNLAIAREIGHMLGLNKRAVRSNQVTGTSGHEMTEMAHALTHAIYHRLNPDVSHKKAQRFADDVLNDLDQIYDTSMLEKQLIHTHESALVEMIESVDIFAEVLPEDKYAIVDTLQKAGHIVGMTGDGVNDAPALKKADCGFAVSNATDAARAAADIILTAPGLSVINHAIEQARSTFERMKSYATFRIAETIRIILFMSLCITVFNFYPITALMIILLALLNDLPILTIAYDNNTIEDKPVRWNMKELFTVSSVLGILGVISSFLLFFILRENGFDEKFIQTLIFLKLLIAGHSTIFVTRNKSWFWIKPWPSPRLLVAIFSTEVIGTIIAVYGIFVTAIGWQYALFAWAYALIWFIVNDAVKIGLYKILNNQTLTHN
jgi:H+-transporting ATPase